MRKKRILLAGLSLVLLFALSGCGGGSSEPAQSAEDTKQAAGEIDLQIGQSVFSAHKYYENLSGKMQGISDGSSDLLEVYSYCEETANFMLELYGRVKDIDDKSAEDYKKAAESYIATVMDIAQKTNDYIDSNNMSDLQDAQESIQLLDYAMSEAKDARNAYLSAAGYTEEEIASRQALDETSE